MTYLFTLLPCLRLTSALVLVIPYVLVIMTIDDDMAGIIGFPCEAFLYGSFIASTGALGRCKPIAHFSFRVLYASLRHGHLYEPERSKPLVESQETSLCSQHAHVHVLLASLRPAVCPFLYRFGMRHAIYESYAISEHHSRIPWASWDFQP